MPSFCVVSNCEFKYTHSDRVSFHKFPLKNPTLLAQWMTFADRGENWKPSRWSAVCSKHFLKADFRSVNSRKCLKKDAVPSVKVTCVQKAPPVDELVEEEPEPEPLVGDESNCRLCGICCRTVTTFATNFEIFGMIQKCFPTLNIQQDDSLPKDMCSQCLDRLKSFSQFVDDVLRTQREFQSGRYAKMALPADRPLKIKQEPFVKQEQIDGFQSFLSDDIDMGIDDDNDCDNKLNFCDFPPLNAQDIIDNCDIMEIINLDDPFIDIPDDETVVKDIAELRLLDMRNIIRLEHNYHCGEIFGKLGLCDQIYKTEITEDEDMRLPYTVDFSQSVFTSIHNFNPLSHEPLFSNFPMKFNLGSPKSQVEYSKPNIVVLNESIVVNERFQPQQEAPIIEPKVIPCNKCSLAFLSSSEYLRHKAKMHWTKPVRSKFKLNFCPICEKPFVSKLALSNHLRYICDYKNQKDMSFGCGFCAKVFDHWRILKNHERECKVARKSGPPLYQCELCQSTYSRPSHLKKHKRRHHSSRAQEKAYSCSKCPKSFRSSKNLHQHRITHSSTKNYKCELCDKTFKRRGGLSQHMNSFHLKIKPHECPVCKYKYALKTDMTRCKHSVLKN